MVLSKSNQHCQPPVAIQPLRQASCHWHALTHRTNTRIPFYYGVLTTSIYCRPTCTARLARRANVRYFSTSSAAETAGYKPCLRCKPDDDLFIGDAEEIVMKILGALGKKIRGLEALSKEVGVTKSYLCRVFKSVMGITIGEYVKEFEIGGQGENSATLPSGCEAGMTCTTTTTDRNSVSGPAGDPPDATAYNTRIRFADEGTPNDPNLDFDLSEWIYTEDLPKHSVLPTT